MLRDTFDLFPTALLRSAEQVAELRMRSYLKGPGRVVPKAGAPKNQVVQMRYCFLLNTHERKCQAHRSPFACGSRFSQDDLGAFEYRQCGCSLPEGLQHRARRARSSSIWRQVSSQSRMGDSFHLRSSPEVEGSIAIFGHFFAEASIQLYRYPTLQSLPDGRSARPSGG